MVTICRPFITTRDGTVVYASTYGRQAFCFSVDEERKAKHPRKNEDVTEKSIKR